MRSDLLKCFANEYHSIGGVSIGLVFQEGFLPSKLRKNNLEGGFVGLDTVPIGTD
jgi:hypothetical protein